MGRGTEREDRSMGSNGNLSISYESCVRARQNFEDSEYRLFKSLPPNVAVTPFFIVTKKELKRIHSTARWEVKGHDPAFPKKAKYPAYCTKCGSTRMGKDVCTNSYVDRWYPT